MPKEGRRNPDKWSVREFLLSSLNSLGPTDSSSYVVQRRTTYCAYLDSGIIDDDFMISSLDQAARDVLELFAGLYEEEAAGGRDFHGYSLPRITCPNVKAWVTRPAVD